MQKTARNLTELEGKHKLAQDQLEDTRKSYDQTRVEYDRLEKELEELDSRIDHLRIESQEKALQQAAAGRPDQCPE